MSNRGSIAKTLGIHTKRLAMTQFLGHWQSAFKGNGIAFAESRPYQAGDPQKRIDRKTTAKKGGELYVKEFEEERQLRFLCVVDSGDSMRQSFGGETIKFDIALNISELFWHAGSQLGDQVGGLGFIDKCGQFFIPKQGLRNLHPFKASLERLYHKNVTEGSSLSAMLKTLVGLRIKNTIILICCDDMLEENMSSLRGLSACNDVIMIHCFDEFEVTLTGRNLKQGLFGNGKTSRYALLESNQQKKYQEKFEEKRSVTEHLIRKAGADYCMIQTHQDPMLELTKFFIRRKQYN